VPVTRPHIGDIVGGVLRRRAERTDYPWPTGFIFDRTTSGRPPKVLSMMDEHTRECITIEVGRKLTGNGVVAGPLAIRGRPGDIPAGQRSGDHLRATPRISSAG